MAQEYKPQPLAENQLALAESVLSLARGLVREINTRQSIRVTLDSKLERDLGLALGDTVARTTSYNADARILGPFATRAAAACGTC